MLPIHIQKIAAELNLEVQQVESTLELLNQDATIPFIARYRKEVTGSLDEVQIAEIKDLAQRRELLESRRQTILKTIESQGKLTESLKQQILKADSFTMLEDIYLPYKPKRRTKAQQAKEKGLEPLATIIFKQKKTNLDEIIKDYINEKVKTNTEALQGSRDIIAEWINEDKEARFKLRLLYNQSAQINSHVFESQKEAAQKYKDYFNYSEPLQECPSHRFLAMMRGEDEGFLMVTTKAEPEYAIKMLTDLFVKKNNVCSLQVKEAVEDSYLRLLNPSIELELRKYHKEKADKEAIKVFASNLRQLLLEAPLGNKRILAIDPAYRTGCKIVCLDEQGDLLYNDVIYPHPPQSKTDEAIKKIKTLTEKYNIQSISIGNGTAGRETESLIRSIPFKNTVDIFSVNEDGASVYSASVAGREEFPHHDITVRGAVSIGRRLKDPLAELVKIDPKAIGVGQYQHDVNQNRLKECLDREVISCVNKVGVNINTASKYILIYISGLGEQLAQNIIKYREKNGPFTSRAQIKKVSRMGPKAFEQSAAFLHIPEAKNPLDNSAVHPESYSIIKKMATDLNCNVQDLITDETKRDKINLENYITPKIGLPTLEDIIKELAKPGRDPREQIKIFSFAPNIHKITDLSEGMILPGIVTNITNFGVFVDMGIKQDGLVHISQLTDKYVSDPNDVVKLHEKVKVKIMDIDIARSRIQLSMKNI